MAITSLTRAFGDGIDLANVSADFVLPRGKRAVRAVPTTSGVAARLSDARLLRTGMLHWCLWNGSASQDLGIEDADFTPLATLLPNETATIHLCENSTRSGSWIVSGASGAIALQNWFADVDGSLWQLQQDVTLRYHVHSGVKKVELEPVGVLPPTGKVPYDGTEFIHLTQN